MCNRSFFTHCSLFFFPKPLALCLALSAILMGCSNSSNSNAESGTADSSTHASASGDTHKAPANKNDVVIANGWDPGTLDPQHSFDDKVANILRQLFLGLVKVGSDGKTAPALANHWEHDRHTVWTFHLDKAVWSNGDPVTAENFVYAWRRLIDPKTGAEHASLLADANVVGAMEILAGKATPDTLGVKALDDDTLQVTLSKPLPYFVDLLVLPALYATPQKTIEQFGDKWTDPANIVVNGAYKLSAFRLGEHVVLERNPHYYKENASGIDKVIFLPVHGDSEINRYRAGEIDMTGSPAPTEFANLKKDLPNELHTIPSLCTFYSKINTPKAPMNNASIRQALAMTLDRDLITKKVLGRGELNAYQFTPVAVNGMAEVKPAWADLPMQQRSAQAIKLLNDAGYSQNKPLKIRYAYVSGDTGKLLTNTLTALWKENLQGIVQIQPEHYEFKTFLSNIEQGNFDMASSVWCAGYNEPSAFLNTLRTDNSNNTQKYHSDKFDQLMNQSLTANSDSERQALYRQAETLLHTDMPVIPIYHPAGNFMLKPYIKGIAMDDPTQSYLIENWQFVH